MRSVRTLPVLSGPFLKLSPQHHSPPMGVVVKWGSAMMLEQAATVKERRKQRRSW